jgi:hypothetical protein
MAATKSTKSKASSSSRSSKSGGSSRPTSSSTSKGSGSRGGSRGSGKRELIDTGTDKRYVRRDSGGKFKESDDVGRSLAQDRRRHAKTVVPKGQGDRGDQKT